MKPLRWDDGTRYDNVNSRWGDGGSYLLEPGDLGYVNTAPVTGGGPTKNPALQISPSSLMT